MSTVLPTQCAVSPQYGSIAGQRHGTLKRGRNIAPRAHAQVNVSAAVKAPEAEASLDLSSLLDAHIESEFTTCNADVAVATMVPHATVTHVPTLTGGQGTESLREFYRDHFIPKMPEDASLKPISRTVGKTSVVDEVVISFTHSVPMDWLLPGIPPTGKKVSVAAVVCVMFEGDKLLAERIYWDQAGVLIQLGLLDPAQIPGAGSTLHGAEQAAKVLDFNAVPTNTRYEATQ